MRKIYRIAIFLFFPLISVAQERIYTLADFPKDTKIYFDMVGQDYMAKKDNSCAIKKFGLVSYGGNSLMGLQPFLKIPDSTSCTKENCDRKRLFSNQKLKIENIVSNSEKIIHPSRPEYTCENNVIFCYFKLRFEDGDVAFMRVANFQQAAEPIMSVIYPPSLQIIPTNPNKSWKHRKNYHDGIVKRRGVEEGFTQEDVLKSQWGKPISKTHTSSNGIEIDIWLYNGGVLSFTDGCVSNITTTSY